MIIGNRWISPPYKTVVSIGLFRKRQQIVPAETVFLYPETWLGADDQRPSSD